MRPVNANRAQGCHASRDAEDEARPIAALNQRPQASFAPDKMTNIFDEFARTDPSPASDTEDPFHFMNRVARPPWDRVRELVNEWFAEYPEASKADLRSRFQDADPGQHYGAWFELYVYKLFRRLGYEMSIHPILATTTRQPDFLVANGDVSMYVECVVSFSVVGPGKGDGGGGE
jgi:hypothetical protein